MREWLIEFLSEYKAGFLAAQVLTILALFLLGLVFVLLVKGSINSFLSVVLAYPLGLSLYIVSGALLLVTDTGFQVSHILITICALLLLCYLTATIARRLESGKGRFRFDRGLFMRVTFPQPKHILIVFFTATAVALIACSGIFSVSIWNDSMYPYALYPRAIVSYGGLRREFNVFLTDVGLGSAIIGTLPYLFGFNETFGIQSALNLNFLIFFGYAIGQVVCERMDLKNSKSNFTKIMIIAGGLFLLMTAMPFVVVSKWAMSNMYFTEFLFICLYTACHAGKGMDDMLVLSVLTIMLSLMRMEGMIIALLAILSYAILGHRSRWLADRIVFPCIVIYGLYYARIFIFMFVDAPYTFLNEPKAAIQMAALIVLYIYLAFIRGRFFKLIDEHLKIVILVGLLLINLLLFVYDRSLYISDVQAFYYNLVHMSGWGVFPIFTVSAVVIIICCSLLDKKRPAFSYMDFFVISYVLITLAVSFARGDALQENVGDSGNRVLLQIVPTAMFAIIEHFIEVCRS